MTSPTPYIPLDAQRRLSLGRIIPKSVAGFLVEVCETGQVVLTPATPLPDVQVSPEILAAVRKASTNIAEGRGVAKPASWV
jgi:hypothetical protein